MKKIKILLLLFILLFTNSFLYAQTCPIKGLADDMADAEYGVAVKNFVTDNDGAKTWDFLFESFGQTRAFTKDIDALTKLKNLLDNNNFKAALGSDWENTLKQILEKNKDLRCTACGNMASNNPFLKNRISYVDLLDNLEYITSFKDKPGFNTIITSLKSSQNFRDGTNFMLQHMRNHTEDFPVSNIEFEYKYLVDALNRADIFVNNILHEFKSWTPDTTWWNNFFSGTGNSYNQFNAYLSHITDLNQLKYIFDPKKLGNTNIKTKFKELFIAKAEDMFTNLGDAKMQQLFGMDGDFQVTNSTMFKNLLNNNETFKNNALKFIVNE